MSRQTERLCWAALACAAIGCEPSATVQAPATAALQNRTLLPWDTAVGRIIGDESASEGPESFALEPDGGLLVLDQVNLRVLDLDAEGRVTGTIALPASTFEDVEQYEGRAVLALDRLVGKVLRVMDLQGTLLVEVPVEGQGIERGGTISAMVTRPDGVWLEVDRRHSVKVLDRQLRPCERQVVLGRPIANGQSLRVELDGNGGARISTGGRTEREAARTATLEGEAPIERVAWLDADARGHVHVALHEIRRATASPFQIEDERYLLVELDEQLRELSRTESPWVRTEYDQFVEFRLGRDGRLWQMAFTPEGVLFVDWGRRQP
jgi:hypothetical protein